MQTSQKRENTLGYKGFTLVEMLLVMVIMMILMSLGYFGGKFAIDRANRLAHGAAVKSLNNAALSYYGDNSEYPEGCSVEDYLEDGTCSSGCTDYCGALAPYLDGFDGGADATYYTETDNTKGVILFCVSLGGIDGELDPGDGWVCAGNGFDVLPEVGGKTVEEPNVDYSTQNNTMFGNFAAKSNWNKSDNGWE